MNVKSLVKDILIMVAGAGAVNLAAGYSIKNIGEVRYLLDKKKPKIKDLLIAPMENLAYSTGILSGLKATEYAATDIKTLLDKYSKPVAIGAASGMLPGIYGLISESSKRGERPDREKSIVEKYPFLTTSGGALLGGAVGALMEKYK